jgi:hypothetical protein
MAEAGMTLSERVKQILVSPEAAWPEIRAEPATIESLFRGYVMPLAAIPAVAGFVGGSVLGYSMMGMHYRVPFISGLLSAAVSYGLSLAGVYILAMIIDALSATFASRKDSVLAMKLAAYSHTASWVAGVFLAIPGLRFLSLFGLYGFYLFYKGLGPVMGTPDDKRLPYTIAVAVSAILVFVVIGMLLRSLVPFG